MDFMEYRKLIFEIYSGKTSLTLCLLRMLELEKGSIKIDNTDISTLAHQFVRSHLVSAPQDSYTFNATVRINLDPAKTASDEEINLVLDKLHMLQNVNKRGGLDAVMSDNFFSQGEAQLFVFARAMLRKGKILILDEVSSRYETIPTSFFVHIFLSLIQLPFCFSIKAKIMEQANSRAQ